MGLYKSGDTFKVRTYLLRIVLTVLYCAWISQQFPLNFVEFMLNTREKKLKNRTYLHFRWWIFKGGRFTSCFLGYDGSFEKPELNLHLSFLFEKVKTSQQFSLKFHLVHAKYRIKKIKEMKVDDCNGCTFCEPLAGLQWEFWNFTLSALHP